MLHVLSKVTRLAMMELKLEKMTTLKLVQAIIRDSISGPLTIITILLAATITVTVVCYAT